MADLDCCSRSGEFTDSFHREQHLGERVTVEHLGYLKCDLVSFYTERFDSRCVFCYCLTERTCSGQDKGLLVERSKNLFGESLTNTWVVFREDGFDTRTSCGPDRGWCGPVHEDCSDTARVKLGADSGFEWRVNAEQHVTEPAHTPVVVGTEIFVERAQGCELGVEFVVVRRDDLQRLTERYDDTSQDFGVELISFCLTWEQFSGPVRNNAGNVCDRRLLEARPQPSPTRNGSSIRGARKIIVLRKPRSRMIRSSS